MSCPALATPAPLFTPYALLTTIIHAHSSQVDKSGIHGSPIAGGDALYTPAQLETASPAATRGKRSHIHAGIFCKAPKVLLPHCRVGFAIEVYLHKICDFMDRRGSRGRFLSLYKYIQGTLSMEHRWRLAQG